MTAIEGIRVLGLTHVHAGPICTMFMGALDALYATYPIEERIKRLREM